MVDFKLPMWDNGRVGFCKPVQPASVHQRLRAWTCLHFQQLLLFSSSKYPVSPFPKHVHGQIGLLLIVIGLIFLHSAEMFPPSAFHLQMLDYSYFILLKLEFVFLLPVIFVALEFWEKSSETVFTLPSSNWKVYSFF